MSSAFIPALFATAKSDTFVAPHHTEALYQAYQGDKNLISFDGDHNSLRPPFFYDSMSIFLIQVLRCETVLTENGNQFTKNEMEAKKQEIWSQKKYIRQ